jgi:crotonobetainyl-CoA:carnitine CoA-transferase CaiB-like acyl-CoA transferase
MAEAVDPTTAPGLLAGLKVLDVATYVAAPAAATVLSDFGADVIKVEPVAGGDPWRAIAARPGMPETPHNFAWTLEGRNKRSIALDLKQPDGRRVIRCLAAAADIFITNLPLRARSGLGIAYEQLAPANERLVYASFTAYGESGMEAGTPGFDTTAWWARSGLMDRVRADEESLPPWSVPGMGDHPSAIAITAAILMALYRRERTGKGGYVGSSLIANGAWANAVYIQAALSGARFPERPERSRAVSALRNYYRCADGRWLMLSLSAAQQATSWPAFARCLDRPDLVDDPRFATPIARREHAVALIALLDAVFRGRESVDWYCRLADSGLTAALISTMDEVARDEQMRASGAFVPMPAAGGAEMTVSSPFWLAGEPKREAQPAPALGAHTDEILRASDFSEAEIARLRAQGVIL